MTHNEDRTHWMKEGLIGLGVGVLYGTTSVTVGHPLDTIKTKMQAQAGFERGGAFKTLLKVLRTQGIVGLYRYTFMDNNFGKYELPMTGGLQVRVCVAGACGSTARAIIECPLELAKIRRQTGQSWQFSGIYKGFGVTWCRTMGLMCTYFILVDSTRRHFPEIFKRPLMGPFLTSGVAATLAWWIVWPLENMKSQVQGNYGKDMSTWQRIKFNMKERGGFWGLYRGLGPGTARSFLANGTSMIVMVNAQKKVSEWGLRG
ncbi:SLC25A13 [Branchiostoma lanceolatum]|uniref:SLC25A13 protein n=1 Tax=Branchiostoma lanceolatum TaxID=7740 RepID=A0A8J9YWF9_BRALA|nr:SLC25A13 [Branchiostoma lanceolatum]